MDKGVQVDLQASKITEPVANYDHIRAIADHLLAKTKYRPTVGVVCGSGLGELANHIHDAQIFNYKDIPMFPVSTAPGHHGRLVFGHLSDKEVVCMQGRLHPYEGYPMWKCSLPIRVMKLLGVETVIITNAAGMLNPGYNIGDIMIIKDHINLPGMAGLHPLFGPNDERFGVRFPAMSKAYDEELREVGKRIAQELKIENIVREGCYAMQAGPTFETIGEARFMRLSGGDVAGMSTVHEVIVAKHCGLRVFGLSLVTNRVVISEDDDLIVDSDHVLEIAQTRGSILLDFISRFIGKL